MGKDLHKRLEEAAEEYAEKHGFIVPYDGSNNFYDETDVKASKDGFIAGAEYGYKEAIAQAKEWLLNNTHKYVSINRVIFHQRMAADLEAAMNKHWEDEK